MKLFNLHLAATLFLFGLTCSAQAQTGTNTAGATATAGDQPGWIMQHVDSAEDTLENLYENGRLSMVLSGEAHHGRGTYTAEKVDQLTEKVWGLGMSKELRDDRGNEEDISFVVMADSHYSPQVTAGYGYQWMLPLGGLEAGIGYTAGLISRTDILKGVPFPGILPLASIGTRDTKLLISYIPKLSGTGDGDVLYLALRISLK